MYRKKIHLHFVGIGGIGMSGIAKILAYQGYVISGCDKDLDQQSVRDLQTIGCTIYAGNNTPECHDATIDIVVYSSALKKDNPELVAAQQRGIPTIPRALMLAELMRTKYSIAIAGAHGKTTTTSLISHILIEAKKDPTVSDRSLLNLQATLAVVTNIDLEHLETYSDIEDIKATFVQFLNNLPFYGKAILCNDDLHIQSLLPMPHLKTIRYGLDDTADLYALNIDLRADDSLFTVHKKGLPEPLGAVHLMMPGKHNVLNALAAIALSLELDIDFATIAQALSSFKGIDRRFTFKGNYQGAQMFDDYGHHPEEIRNTLLVARKKAERQLTVVFQPHRYTRTHKLWDHFVSMFAQSTIDHLIITDIYAASESPISEVNGYNLAQAIQRAHPRCTVQYIPYDDQFNALKEALKSLAPQNGDLILLQGAGRMNHLPEYLV
jgi:UDP-N-acetylmuramate--alanine ligase